MVLSSLAGFFGPAAGPGHSAGDATAHDATANELARYLQTNRNVVAWANLGGGIGIAVLAPHLHRLRWARHLLCALVGLACFINVAAVALGVGGLVLLAIPVLTLAATLAMFRSQAQDK